MGCYPSGSAVTTTIVTVTPVATLTTTSAPTTTTAAPPISTSAPAATLTTTGVITTTAITTTTSEPSSPSSPPPAIPQGLYALKNVKTQKYLNVVGGSSANGANVQIWDNPLSNHSQWIIRPVGYGVYTLENKNSGKFLI